MIVGVVWFVEPLGIVLLIALIIMKSTVVRAITRALIAQLVEASACHACLPAPHRMCLWPAKHPCRRQTHAAASTVASRHIATLNSATVRRRCAVGRCLLSAPHRAVYEPGCRQRLLGGPLHRIILLRSPHGPGSPLRQTMVRRRALPASSALFAHLNCVCRHDQLLYQNVLIATSACQVTATLAPHDACGL